MAYAERLKAAGVAVDAAVAPGMIHGFFSMFELVPDANVWIDRAGANLDRRHWHDSLYTHRRNCMIWHSATRLQSIRCDAGDVADYLHR